MPTITGNVIKITGSAALTKVRFTSALPNEVVDGSPVSINFITVMPDESGDFSTVLVPSDYTIKAGSFVATIRVPDTTLSYDVSALFISPVNTPGQIPQFGLPTSGDGWRFNAAGALQFFVPETGLYYTARGEMQVGRPVLVLDPTGEA